jgi:(3S)-linalool synthase
VKETLANAGEDLQQLVMVDAMQRLGVAYHFQEEIEVILQKQYTRLSAYSGNHDGAHQLFEVSLRFQLLRQQGYPVTPGTYGSSPVLLLSSLHRRQIIIGSISSVI